MTPNPKRYSLLVSPDAEQMRQDPDGAYILHRDYAALEAEAQKLRVLIEHAMK